MGTNVVSWFVSLMKDHIYICLIRLNWNSLKYMILVQSNPIGVSLHPGMLVPWIPTFEADGTNIKCKTEGNIHIHE